MYVCVHMYNCEQTLARGVPVAVAMLYVYCRVQATMRCSCHSAVSGGAFATVAPPTVCGHSILLVAEYILYLIIWCVGGEDDLGCCYNSLLLSAMEAL